MVEIYSLSRFVTDIRLHNEDAFERFNAINVSSNASDSECK